MRDTNTQPILRAIVSLAGPAVMGFLLHNAYHVNDAYFLGRVGPAASNAMGLFMMVMIANFGFAMVIARGTASLVGRRFGAGQRDGAARAVAQGLGTTMRVVVPLTLVQWIWAPEILQLVGGRGDTVQAGTEYLRWLFPFMPFLFAQPVLDLSFQAMGDTTTPFRNQVVAVVVNTGLNWLLVLPHTVELLGATWTLGGMGVAGAALATGVSRLVGTSLAFWVLVRRRGVGLLMQRRAYRVDGRVVREILRVGGPAGASILLYAVVGMAVLSIIGRFGQDAFGGYGIGFRGIESVSFMIVLGLGVATGTVVSHAVGAGNFDRARRAAHVGALAGAATMCVTTFVLLVFPRQLVSLFTADPRLIEVAVTYVSLMAMCQVAQGLEIVYADAMAGAGSSARTVLITIPGNVLRYPLGWLLAVTLDMGLTGVWWAIVASAVLKGLGVTALFLSGRWEKAMLKGRALLDAA